MEIEEGLVVLATVERIISTTVFVKLENGQEGSINFSEIAPGRIRNIREYVVPNKKIVCKILRIKENRIELSLRRVTQKEQKEIVERYNLKRSYEKIFQSILKEKSKEILAEIEKENNLLEFILKIKDKPEMLEKYASKEEADKILAILNSQKEKSFEIKKTISFVSTNPDGLEIIKNIFSSTTPATAKYISAGKYSLKIENKNPKQAEKDLNQIINNIIKKAHEKKIQVQIKEK